MKTWFSPFGTEWQAETYEEALEAERDALHEQLEAAQKVIEAATDYVFSSDGNAFGKFHDVLVEYATSNPAKRPT